MNATIGIILLLILLFGAVGPYVVARMQPHEISNTWSLCPKCRGKIKPGDRVHYQYVEGFGYRNVHLSHRDW